MPKELVPSSYLCDCGHQSHFSENTIREAKAMSRKRVIHLVDSASNEHTIVFYKGQMVDILCPEQAPDARVSTEENSSRIRRTTVSGKGTVTIPAAWRKRYGILPGSFVDLEDRNGEIVIRLRSPAYKEARGMLSGGPSLTADLLAERARDREREEAKIRA
jgi:AbrB family looped-hinge helix DNA binding protein